jgi:hypothetical protein
MELPSLTDLELYHYLAIGGGAIAVLALLLYFLPVSRIKVPAVLVGIIGSLAAGIGIGVVAMAAFGYHWESQREAEAANAQPAAKKGGFPGGGKGGFPGGGKGGFPGGKGGFPGGKKGKPAGPQEQLADLLAKLDLLTGKPPALKLSADEKEATLAALNVLAQKKDADANTVAMVLSTLISTFKEDRAVLEAVGFRWPADDGKVEGPAAAPATLAENPHLKALRKRLQE